MRYLDEFRDPETAHALVAAIRRTATRRRTLMEVCGGQTHSLLRHGIDEELQDVVELVHGPGCPVCVTPPEAIELAISLSHRPKTVLASFGDMLRVPSGTRSLVDERAAGASVQPVYSPLDAVELASRHPDQEVVFFAVGFETTAPATALAVCQAASLGLKNFSLLVAHVRVLPAMELIASAADRRVEGFLAAGHVCTVMGYEEYQPFAEHFRMPVVVTGFEPVDLLAGILECIRLLESGQYDVTNRYGRMVRTEGNLAAVRLVNDVFEPCDRPWRGFGNIADGGLRLRAGWRQFDAQFKFQDLVLTVVPSDRDCPSGDVMSGRIKPAACPHFGGSCTPDHPLGAPMVSSEGACAAYYRYANVRAGLMP
jgi:hydrogenase expression/formation protein HypD